MKMICSGCRREMKSTNRPHGFLLHAILKIAEMAYQSDIIDPQTERDMIGPGKEYADKDAWMASWFYGILENEKSSDKN